jgi:hypothetical protein
MAILILDIEDERFHDQVDILDQIFHYGWKCGSEC